MIISGILIAESPVYRGNARKTIFTRDDDGKHRLVSLAGEVSGTAQALMDAFIGSSRNKKNTGQINQMWYRLYGEQLPPGLIQSVQCTLQSDSYLKDRLFDLRMGIRLNEDRWAAESNANYKMETILKNSRFDFKMNIKTADLSRNDNSAKLYYLLLELKAGRFWFGAGKTKGLGRLRFEGKLPFDDNTRAPEIKSDVNHLVLDFQFDSTNPVLVGWNWGKVDPFVPAFQSIEGRFLLDAVKDIPEIIKKRLAAVLSGPILNIDDWKQKLTEFLPKTVALEIISRSGDEKITYQLTEQGIANLQKGKHSLSKKLINKITPMVGKSYASEELAKSEFARIFGKKANMAKRVIAELEEVKQTITTLDTQIWQSIAGPLGLPDELKEKIEACKGDEAEITELISAAIKDRLPQIFQQLDQHMKMLQSDAWVDHEIADRENHIAIKQKLKAGDISEKDWNNPNYTPEGISSAAWQEFKDSHANIQFRFLLNPGNLNKSITNDQTQIELLRIHRERTRQELVQPHHIDFRAGGTNNREISKQYGKPYDTVFMRMLSWKPSSTQEGQWEIFIPGATVKGAFRKRAAMVLRNLWGETRETDEVLTRLFGAQGCRGLLFFSDAYLSDPEVPENAWCSLDGVKMDPRTGQPIETAKRDCLYAYGKDLVFNLRIDTTDIIPDDLTSILVFQHLLNDFRNGDIPLGGEKTSGFGWVKGKLANLLFLTGGNTRIKDALFQNNNLQQAGIWKALRLKGDEAWDAVKPSKPIESKGNASSDTPPVAKEGYVSHRAFGGYCGILKIEAAVLSPLTIKESGEPSFSESMDGEYINGWDFFSISPPAAKDRAAHRIYAIPSRSIKGCIRHIYTIAAQAKDSSVGISRLNTADQLFGYVGDAPNQALMGRLVVTTARFDQPKLSWFKVPYPYGNLHFENGKWVDRPGKSARMVQIDGRWRIYPHAPLAPIVGKISEFQPDTVQAAYVRAILPEATARFSIRFWNLYEEELRRLLWSVCLDPDMAHKLGAHRYLGFGAVKFNILPESYLIDWKEKYGSTDPESGRISLNISKWCDTKTVKNYPALKEALRVH